MANDYARDLPRAFLRDLPVYLVAGGLFAICIAIFANYGISVGPDAITANARLYMLAGFAMFAFDASSQLVRNRPQSPAGFLLALYGRRLRSKAVLSSLPALALIVVFMPFFSKMKSAIPLFNDFSWDAAFIAWDRGIFFGYDAWEVIQPVFGYPVVTAAMAVIYHAWMLLIYVGTLFFLFYRSGAAVRRQYLLGFFVIWTVIGGAMATMFASVGPCFMEPMLGDPHFAAQMAYLNAANEQVPILTLHVQDLLLEWHQAEASGLGSGITAMPSMHVAMAMLFWLAIRRVSRNWGRFFFAFLVAIWIGSVHLAYHYAVDGLVSVIATWLVWKAAGRLLKWWDTIVPAVSQPALRTNTVPAE